MSYEARLFNPDALRRWWVCPWCGCTNGIPDSHLGWGLYPAGCVGCRNVVSVWPNTVASPDDDRLGADVNALREAQEEAFASAGREPT